MLVGERMSRPVKTIAPETPINDVLAMFKKEHIRRTPVIKDGKLIGIISHTDLLNASRSKWEGIKKADLKKVLGDSVKKFWDVRTI